MSRSSNVQSDQLWNAFNQNLRRLNTEQELEDPAQDVLLPIRGARKTNQKAMNKVRACVEAMRDSGEPPLVLSYKQGASLSSPEIQEYIARVMEGLTGFGLLRKFSTLQLKLATKQFFRSDLRKKRTPPHKKKANALRSKLRQRRRKYSVKLFRGFNNYVASIVQRGTEVPLQVRVQMAQCLQAQFMPELVTDDEDSEDDEDDENDAGNGEQPALGQKT
jgi:hypothetical protein